VFKQVTYKQKVKLLPIVFLVALLLIYGLAIRETLNMKRGCHDLTEQTKVAGDAPQQMARIHGKLDELNLMMGKDTVNSGTDPLLEFVSTSVNTNIGLVDFQPMHVFQHQNYRVETRIATFEGSFVNLLKFLNNLEKGFKSGKVVSVKFQTETNFKTDRKRLLMVIYIQSVKNDENQSSETQSQSKS
jgi:hypothetical protein